MFAKIDLLKTPILHVAGKFHVLVNRIVDGLDSVGVVDSHHGIVRSLLLPDDNQYMD